MASSEYTWDEEREYCKHMVNEIENLGMVPQKEPQLLNVEQFEAGTPEKMELFYGILPFGEGLLLTLLYNVGFARMLELLPKEAKEELILLLKQEQRAGNPENQSILDAMGGLTKQEADQINQEVHRERDEDWDSGVKKIIKNKIRCKHCGDVIESVNNHDFTWCSCKKVGVDGGRECLRRVGSQDDYEELAIMED